MVREARYVNLSDLHEVLAWEHLVDEVRTTKQPTSIRADGEDAVELKPAKKVTHRRKGRRTSADDAFWSLVGIGASGKVDLSANHDQYLAKAKMSISNESITP